MDIPLILLFCLMTMLPELITANGCLPFSSSLTKLSTTQLNDRKSSIVLSSPGYPSLTYSSNVTCSHRVFAPPGYYVKFEFVNSTYDIEPSLYSTCKYDLLELRDGPYPYSPILGRFCSRTVSADSMMSRTNAVHLSFTSDSSIEGGGFHVQLTMQKMPPYETQDPDTKICRILLTGTEGEISIDSNHFRGYINQTSFGRKADLDDDLIECSIDVDPVVDEAAYLLLQFKFDTLDPKSHQLPQACSLHRFEFYDIGIRTTEQNGQNLVVEPSPLKGICTPTQSSIVVTETAQASIRILMKPSVFFDTKDQDFYANLQYSVLTKPELCQKDSNSTNPDYGKRSTGVWCSIDQITSDSISSICLHYSLRCNGRNNCPATLPEGSGTARTSRDEMNCEILRADMVPENEKELEITIDSEQILKLVLVGSFGLVAIIIVTGLGCLLYRRISFEVAKIKHRRYRNKQLSMMNQGKRLGLLEPPVDYEDPPCCCCCYYCNRNSAKDNRNLPKQLPTHFPTVMPRMVDEAAAMPPIVALRMSSDYRNLNSSPAFVMNKSMARISRAKPKQLQQQQFGVRSAKDNKPSSESSNTSPSCGNRNKRRISVRTLKKNATRYYSGTLLMDEAGRKAKQSGESCEDSANWESSSPRQQSRMANSFHDVISPGWFCAELETTTTSAKEDDSEPVANVFTISPPRDYRDTGGVKRKAPTLRELGMRASPPMPFKSIWAEQDSLECSSPLIVRLADLANSDMSRSMPSGLVQQQQPQPQLATSSSAQLHRKSQDDSRFFTESKPDVVLSSSRKSIMRLSQLSTERKSECNSQDSLMAHQIVKKVDFVPSCYDDHKDYFGMKCSSV